MRKMYFGFLTIICLLFSSISNAQWSELGGTNALGANRLINSICSDASGNVYAGGDFRNSSNKRYVAKWNGSSWSELGGTDALGANGSINSVCTDASGNLYASGSFTNANSNRYVAKYDGTSWTELGGTDALGANNTIYSICSDASGNIYAAGWFTNANGNYYVAKYDGTSWSELGGTDGLGANGFIFSICTDASGNLYASGSFTNANSKYVAKYDGTNWNELGGDDALGANNNIYSICSDASGNIYASGWFTNANGNRYVAKYDGTNWSELGGTDALNANGNVFSVYSDASGNVYTGGQFKNSNNKYYVAKYNGTSWGELGGTNALSANLGIISICSDASGNIYTAGNFVNASAKRYVAKYSVSTCTPTASTTTTSACDSLRWNGTKYTASGTYTYNTTNAAGCDSTATLNLTVNHPSTSSATTSACDSLVWNGTTYTTSGTYTWGGTNAAGCDSTATLNLTVNHSNTSSTTTSACDSLVWNGTTYTTSGTYTWGGTNAAGCDSTATLNVTINHPSTSSTTTSACDSLVWNGTTYTTSGTYTWGGTNAAGCDSTATLNLTVNHPSSSSNNLSICSSQLPYTWNGLTFNAAGSQTAHLTNSVSCDSAATLNLSILSNSTSTTNTTICSNQLPYNWNGSRTSAGTYTYNTTNSVGCDSVATLNLTVNAITAPTFTSCPTSINVTPSTPSSCGATVTYTAPVATANCSFTTTQISGLPSGSFFPPGVTTNTFVSSVSGAQDGVYFNSVNCANTSSGPLSIAISGNVLFYGNWNAGEISAYNIFDPSNPTFISTIDLDANTSSIYDIKIAGNYLYTVSRYGQRLQVVDISNPAAMSIVGQTSNNVFSIPVSLELNGNYAYVACEAPAAVKVFDISNPANLTSVGSVDLNNGALSARLKGNYLYVTTYTGLQVVDISNPTSPTVVSSISLGVANYYMSTVNYVNNYLYVGVTNFSNDSYIKIYDISTPSSPSFQNNFSIGSAMISKINSSGNLLYCAQQTSNQVGAATVIDVTTPTAPTIIAQSPASYSGNRNILFANNYLFTNNYGASKICVYSTPTSAQTLTTSCSFTVTVNATSTSTTNTTICSNLLPYHWNGLTFNAAGSQTAHLTNSCGVDSAATLNLTVLSTSTSSTSVTICANQAPYVWNGNNYSSTGPYTVHFTNSVGCDSAATLNLTVNTNPSVAPIVGLTNIEILAVGGGGGAGGPDGALGAGGGAGGAVYGAYTLSTTGSSIYTVGVGGAGGYGQGCAGNAAGGTAGANGGAAGGNAGTGGCSGGGGGSGGWSGLYQGSNYIVVAGGGAGGGGSNEGTANDVTTPGGGNQSAANGTSMTGQNGTAYSGDGGGGGAGGGGFYGGAGQSNLNATGTTASQAYGGANYASTTGRNSFATYIGNSGATSSTGTGGQGTTSTITNASNFNYSNTYGKGGNAQGNGGTSTTANGNNGVVIIRYPGSPVATGGTVTQSGGYTLHTFTSTGSNTFTANSGNSVCAGSTTTLNCATTGGVWSSSDTTIATINASTGLVTGIVAGTVTITYTVTNAQGCVGTSTKSFTVNPLPTVPAITGNTIICDNTTTALSNTLTGGVWSSSLPAKATVNASTGLVTGVASGSTAVTYLYTDNNGCSSSVNTTVTINASPTVAAIAGNASVCIGSTTTFTNATTGGTWTSGTTSVATINSSGLITTVATGSSTISYTVINASVCTTFVTKSITVNALPNVTANATASTVCFGTQTTLTGGNASSYIWNNGVTNGVAFAPSTTTTYTVTGTDGNGCVKTANITITVNPLPIVSISPSATTLCNGYSSTLTASGASTYGWTIVGSTPYLDQVSSISTLKLAAGLHKLKGSYSGAAIRIRRSSDNTEQDFGFSGNDLDVASISTFIGAGTAYVKTLYDQSGNGNHLSQTSTGNQPTLTLSGLNGKPVIHTNTSQNIYIATNFPTPFSIVYAARQTGGTRGRVLADWSGNNWLLGYWNGNKGCAHFNGWVSPSGGTAAADNSVYIYTGTATGSNSSFVYQNGTNITANSSGGNAGPNGLTMNRWENGNEPSDADFTDLVEFNSVLSTTDRQIVENGMGAYYGLSGFYNTTGATTTVTPSTTSSYTVYGTNGNGCIGTATQAITVNPKPNAGADLTLVCGGTTQTLTGTANTGTWTALGTNPTGATLSSTTSGVATVAFTNLASGTFSFIYTLPTTNCSDTMNITVGSKPNAGSDISSICGGYSVSLGGTPTTGAWSAMSTNPSGGSSSDAPFSASSSALKLWIDATKFSTTNGGSVSGVISDASSYARTLTSNATYETTGFNGKPSVRYNNNQTSTPAFNTDQNTYVYTTLELVGAGSSWASVFYHWSRDYGLTIEQNGTAASNVYHWQTGNDNSGCNQTISFGTKYIMAATITGGNVRNFTLYQDNNGSLQNLGTVSNSSYSVPVQLGSLFLGKSDGGEYTNMRMGEFIYFQGSLPVSESSIINYLYSKWLNGNGGSIFTTSGATTINYANAAAGTYNYIYTVPTGCTDTMSVVVTPKPNAGNDINFVCGGSTQTISGTTTDGTWTALGTNPTGATLSSTTTGVATVAFANLASGTYSFIYTLPTNCSDTMSITVRPKPNAGADQAVCILNVAAGVTLTSNVTGTWSAMSGNAGTASIVSASSASTQVNNFSVIGNYNYINTNNGCTDTVKVTVTPSGSIGNYVWADINNDGLQNESASAGINGISVQLYQKDGTGAFNLYASTTTANNGSGNPGYYNFGICEDGVYKVKFPTTNPYTQTNLSTYTATANTDGNSDADRATGYSPEITINTYGTGYSKDNNTIDAGYQVCTKPVAGNDFNSCGMQVVTITGVSTTPALPTTDGNWRQSSSNSTGATLSTTNLGVATVQFDSTANGNYSFIYYVTGGCEDTMSITVEPKPYAGTDVSSICGGQTQTVVGSPTGGTWAAQTGNPSGATVSSTSNGVANISFANLSSGLYTFIYTTAFGCTDTMTITAYPKPDAGSDVSYICGGHSQTITATPGTGTWTAMSGNPSGATVGSTSNGVTTIDFTDLSTGVYSFIYTVPSGCTDTMRITAYAKPNAGSDLTEVCGGSILSLTGTPSTGTWSQAVANASGATVGSTSNGIATISFANLVSGTYTFIFTSVAGCTDTMTISTKPKPNAGSDVYMECGTPRLFDSVRATPTGGTWAAMAGNPTGVTLGSTASGKARINLPVAPTQGIWTFIYTAPDGCTDTMSYTIGVTGTPAPAINSGSNPICGNSTVQICPTQFGWSNYQWYKNGVAVSGIAGTQSCITIDTSKVGSYTLAGTNGSACWSKQSPAVVVSLAGAVTPTITVQGGATTACNNGSITLISSSLNNNQWNKDDVAISGATSQYYNATTSGVYTVTATNCGYTRTSTGTTITIVPQINVSSIQSSTGTVCTGSPITLTDATTGGVWSSSNTAKATVNASGVVSGISVGSVTITYTVTISGCSNSSSYTLNVVDGSNITAPIIAAQGSTALCGNSNVQICPTVWGWSNYQWYKGGIAVSQNGTGSCITVDTSKLGSYTLSATNNYGCWSPLSNAIVVATASTPATPTISVNGSSSTCNGQSINLTSSASSGNQWKKNGVAISGATGQTYQATVSGVYTVTVTDNCGGNATSAGTTLTITPSINLNSIQSNSSSVCTSGTTTLTNTTTGGVWSSSNNAIASINPSSGVVTGVDTGHVTITYTITIGSCSNSVSMSLTVVDGSSIAAPSIAVQGSTAICGSTTVQLCTATYGWSNYQWYKNGVAVAQNGTSSCITVDTSKLGSYTLAATTGSGCWSPQSSATVVSAASAPATPTISVSGSATVCNGGTVTLTSSASTGNQWKKDGVAISGATSQTYTVSTSGVYTVTVTNCGSATSAGTTITVVPHITVNSIQSVTGTVCKNASTTLVNTTTGGVWSSSNNSIATINPSTGLMSGVDTGIVTITYTVTINGCSNFVQATFTVVDGSNIVPPTIVAQSSATICSNGNVTLCPTAYGWSNYQWYKNGVAVLQNGYGACITVDTSKLGSYTLAATTGNGCWSNVSNTIIVSSTAAPATPTISAGGSTTLCNGGNVVLTSSASSGNQWNKNGVAISGATSTTYTATTAGVYTVTATNCGGSTTSAGTTVTIASPISVAAITASSSNVCMGSTVTLTDTTSGGVWSSSNTAIATVNASGIVTPVSGGTVTISYTVTVGACSNAATYNLTVPNGGTVAAPTLDVRGATAICGTTVLQICPATYGWSNYQWYKNGVAIAAPTGTGACINIDTSMLGSYTLAGTNGFGCWSAQSIAVPVTLAAAPATPTITASGSTTVCNGASVVLTSSSASSNQWKKDGVVISGATSQSYTATTSGVYTVTVTTCGSTTSAGTTITVIAPITVASITASSSSVCLGNSITLSNATSGGVWSSSNTAVATINSSTGVVTTVAGGSTTISYTVTVGSCSNAATYGLSVLGSSAVTTPTLDIRGSTAICGSGSLQICPLVWGYSNYQWYKNGVAYSTSACITVNTAGAYTLTGTNGNGCWSAQSTPANVTINAIPTVNATTGATSVCVGNSITLTNTTSIPSGGTGVWTSTAGRANITSNTGVVTGTSAGTATLVYTITSSVGCSASASYNVAVNALPAVPSISFAGGTTGITGSGGYCHNKTFTLLGSPSGGAWSSVGAFSITTGGVVTTANTAGSGSVTYTATDANGCSNSRTISANVIASCKGIATNSSLSAVEPIIVYPNPAHSTVSFKIKTLIGTGTVVVTDLYGKQLKLQSLSMGTNTIDVSHFAKGMYLISIITEQGKQTQKVVVE